MVGCGPQGAADAEEEAAQQVSEARLARTRAGTGRAPAQPGVREPRYHRARITSAVRARTAVAR